MIDQKQSSMVREFSKSNVTRMRNLLTGKSGDRTQTQLGYEKDRHDRSEGDVWEEDGRQWTIKDGIRQNITKLDRIRSLSVMPLSCPCCNKIIPTDPANKKMWSIHGKCLDCVIHMEQEIKLSGGWEEYERRQIKSNIKSSIEDFEMAMDAWYAEKETFVTEGGDVEAWTAGDKSKLYNAIKSDIEKLKSDTL